MDRKVALLALLYFCQGLPGGFLAVVLPVLLIDRGLSLATVGFASALSLPWVLKILWAPLVDRYWWPRLGRRKSWMLPTMAGMIACTLAMSGLDPYAELAAVAAVFGLLNLFAATQDVAVDGFAVGLLRGRELGPGNAAQIGGFKLGNIFGGGVLLAAIGVLGWRGDLLVMAAIIAVALVIVALTREPPAVDVAPAASWDVAVRAFRSLVRPAGYAAFLAFAKFAETMGGSLVKPSLKRHGIANEVIGTIDGIVGGIATAMGALVGGALARRLGWRPTLAMASVVQGGAIAAIAVYQLGEIEVVGFAARLAVENFAGGAVGVAVFMLAMSRCNADIGATEFTAAQVVYMGGAAVAAPLAGALADASSIADVMLISAGLTAIVAIVAWRVGDRLSAA